jgi:hypothetical protein
LARYHLNEGSFELGDDGFVDVTVHTLDVEVDGASVRLMVKRAPFGGGSLSGWSERRAALQGAHLRGYALLETREPTEARVEFSARYIRVDRSASYLRCAQIASPGSVLSLTATAALERRATCDAFVDVVLESLLLRDGD